MREATINKTNQVFYVSDGTIAGLTDLIITVKRPDNSILYSTAMEDYTNGMYSSGYTPDILGDWTEIITSVTNGDNILRNVKVVAYDIVDAVTKINSVETKVDALDVKVVDVATDVNALDTKLDTVSAKADEIITKTDAVKTVVDSNSDKLDGIDIKINNLPTAKRYGYFA